MRTKTKDINVSELKKEVENKVNLGDFRLYITKHQDDKKMESLHSLSTSPLLNSRCLENAKIKGSICEKCYSNTMNRMYGDLAKLLMENTFILSEKIIPDNEILRVYDLYFRLESFGDLQSEIQVLNYFNICFKNPRTNFTLWTKNPDYILSAMDRYGLNKPKNLNIGISSLMINKVRDITKYKDICDFVFTVYSADYALKNNIKINCGNRKCIECLKCYSQIDGIKYVNEMLKSDLKKYLELGGKIYND